MKYLELSYLDVGLAAVLIVLNGAISIALGLRLERSLLLASIRTILQLLLIGFVLDRVFEIDKWYVVLGLLLVTGHGFVSATSFVAAALPSCVAAPIGFLFLWWPLTRVDSLFRKKQRSLLIE